MTCPDQVPSGRRVAEHEGDIPPSSRAFAQLIVGGESHGVHALVVPIRDERGELCEGVRIEDCGEYTSPIENPSKRFFTMLGTLVQGRVSISAASVTTAKTALTIAIRYGLRRRQFGPPGQEEVALLQYRSHQRRLIPALASTFALHFAQQELSSKFHAVFSAGDPPERERRELESLAAAMKATTSWHSVQTIQTCRECCGGAGYMAVNRFAALRADVDIFTTFEGDNTVLMLLAAKGLLTDYGDHFDDLNPVGMVTFVASQVVEVVVERLVARQWREGHVIASVANRFKRGLNEGYDPFEVFRAVQDHAIAAARAHMSRLVLEAFMRAIERCEDEQLIGPLHRLCDLYALANLEEDRAFFQEHGRLSGPRCKAITREVNRLCDEVSTQAGLLVDAFGIPDAILAAPIGLRGIA